jgi:alpha-D-ribose 1-methylphosphonate 5-triphosphate synthase subunit PhnH
MRREASYDEVFDGQRDFRVILDAMARPGTIRRVEAEKLEVPAGWDEAAAVVALALLDRDTTFWAEDGAVAEYIRGNTRSREADAAEAEFLFAVGAAGSALAVTEATVGNALYPESGATVVLPAAFSGSVGVTIEGPGVAGTVRLDAGLPPELWQMRQERNAEFPLGLDWILTDGDRLVCVPRSTRVRVE